MSAKVFRAIKVGVLSVLLLSGAAFAETYSIDPVHSNVAFSIRHIVSRVSGAFTGVSGTIVYDAEKPEQASVQATIQTASINTNNERRDNHLKSPDFFDAEKYPEIAFKSAKVEKTGDKLMVTGDLTMHGVTKQVVLPVAVLVVGVHPMRKTPVAGFEAEITLKRSDFEVNTWTDAANVLGDEVKITLNIEAVVRGEK